MTIIKKSGKKERFSAEKLSLSIAAASNAAREPLNEDNLKKIITEFQLIAKGRPLITTQQIDIIITGILYSKGYYTTLEYYASYAKRK